MIRDCQLSNTKQRTAVVAFEIWAAAFLKLGLSSMTLLGPHQANDTLTTAVIASAIQEDNCRHCFCNSGSSLSQNGSVLCDYTGTPIRFGSYQSEIAVQQSEIAKLPIYLDNRHCYFCDLGLELHGSVETPLDWCYSDDCHC